VFRAGGYADAVVNLELSSLADRTVRVHDVRISFLDGERLLRQDRPGAEFFLEGPLKRPSRVERGRTARWTAVCLLDPPPEADRVRFELELVMRRGLTELRSRDVVEAALEPAPASRALRLPFTGYWRVSQGHTCTTNHRLGGYGGTYAWDLVALGPDGSPVKEGWEVSRRNADTYTFGRDVLAPADGRVVRIVDAVTDNEGLRSYPRRSLLEGLDNPEWVFGNFVVLEIDDGSFLLLGHLQEGSIRVRPGDRVSAGAVLARAGNSGNSIAPHLHLQRMSHPDPEDPRVRGLPAVFDDYMEFLLVREGPQREVLARRRDAGDPVEGSILAPAGELPAPGPPRPGDGSVR
jgi:hypothetical protein